MQGICNECKSPVLEDHRYCYNCGNFLAGDSATISIFNNYHLRQIFYFYFLYLAICLLVKHNTWFKSYDQLFWVELVLAIVTIKFAWLNKGAIKPVLKFNNFKWYRLLGVILIAALGSFLVSYGVQELNINFFRTQISYYTAYKIYTYPTLVMLYSIAIMPAIFEELAFRGVMYNYCSNFLDEKLVVAVTAFLFATMHLSLISLVWLIPFGFFIGNLRRKYNTLWYGFIFHFTFNLTACVFDLYKEGLLFS